MKTNITEQEISDNADKLIALGFKEWMRGRKRSTTLSQREKLRNIEDSLIDDDKLISGGGDAKR